MIETDLTDLYSTPAKRLHQAVHSNLKRTPSNFILRLVSDKKQWIVINCDHVNKLTSSLLNTFIEYRALIIKNVSKSPWVIEISLLSVRTLVQIRKMLRFATKFTKLEGTISSQPLPHRITSCSLRSIGFTANLSKLLNE